MEMAGFKGAMPLFFGQKTGRFSKPLVRKLGFRGHRILAAVVLAVNQGDSAEILKDRVEGFELFLKLGAEGRRQVALQKPADDVALAYEVIGGVRETA